MGDLSLRAATAATMSSAIEPVPSDNLQLFKAFLAAHPAVRFIRLQNVDLAGTVRARTVTRSYMEQTLAAGGTFSVPSPVIALLFDDSGMFDQLVSGVDGWLPDCSTLTLLPSPAGLDVDTAVVLTAYKTQGPAERSFELCPRTILKRAIHRAKTATGLDLLVGFEIEMAFLDPASPTPAFPPHAPTGSNNTIGMRWQPYWGVVEESVRRLDDAGIPVQQFHSEAPGIPFYEISLAPLPPLAATDALVHALELIRGVAAERGTLVTFHPKPTRGPATIGLHAHLSITPAAAAETPFLAGVMAHLPALTALGMPIHDSYGRMGAALGTPLAWGTQNKMAAVRKIRAGHWELRTIDATANMYLVLAGFLHAGVGGVEERRELTLGDLPLNYMGATEAEKRAANVTRELPGSLKEAMGELEGDEEVRGWLGERVVALWLEMKRREEEKWAAMEPDERRALGTAVW